MNRWQIAAVIGSVWLLIAAAVIVLMSMIPGITPPDRPPVHHPTPAPTSTTAPVHPGPAKTGLIIQQNVNCWMPWPGYICTGREYL